MNTFRDSGRTAFAWLASRNLTPVRSQRGEGWCGRRDSNLHGVAPTAPEACGSGDQTRSGRPGQTPSLSQVTKTARAKRIALDLGLASSLDSEGYLRLAGGANQVLAQRFDIEARTAADVAPLQKRLMLPAGRGSPPISTPRSRAAVACHRHGRQCCTPGRSRRSPSIRRSP